jgi:hypothetical protein
MKLNKGMITDVTPNGNPEGSWRNARNIVISKTMDAVTNEDGFTVYCNNYPTELRPVGYVTALSDVVIFSTGAIPEIGIVNYEGVYRTVVRDTLLKFDERFPVSAIFKQNFRGDIIVQFVDNYNPIRLLNLTTLPFELNDDFSLKRKDSPTSARRGWSWWRSTTRAEAYGRG